MKRLRVLLLITNLGKGGAQRVFHDHALAFSAVHDVEEAVFDLQQDARIYDTGLPLHGLRRNGLLFKLGPIGRLFSRTLVLRKLVTAGGFDVVISHMDGANWVNVLSFTRARKILVVHGTVLRDENVSVALQWFRKRLIFPWLYNLADHTVAVSKGIALELAGACGVRNALTIPNFFELQGITDKTQQALDEALAPIFNHPAVLITSGRLAEQKKQAYLLDMMGALRARGLSVRLVILGDGELRDRLVVQSQALGLRTFHVWGSDTSRADDGDVFFLGYVSNPYQYLARSTLFLFPSGWEGFPLALCEAMVADVPVLSADCPTGPREILAPGTVRDTYDLRSAEMARNGVLLPMIESRQDLVVWVDSIERLLSDAVQRERLRANAAQAMKALDRSEVVGQWLRLIEKTNHVH
jgi:glycosyltransferase involved in cell wall biosynthesis